ncbi:hypothetical protein [Rhizobium puerariae]|uniref:hypothetical protein n=1 Tax=Rhizobium puerariae TaxID=1585791 RepID=UPI003672ECDB
MIHKDTQQVAFLRLLRGGLSAAGKEQASKNGKSDHYAMEQHWRRPSSAVVVRQEWMRLVNERLNGTFAGF